MSDMIPVEQCLRTADVERVLQSVIRFFQPNNLREILQDDLH